MTLDHREYIADDWQISTIGHQVAICDALCFNAPRNAHHEVPFRWLFLMSNFYTYFNTDRP